jgi:hypothetical protein
MIRHEPFRAAKAGEHAKINEWWQRILRLFDDKP